MKIENIKVKKKYAALTCDIEEDYGFRTNTIEWLNKEDKQRKIKEMLEKHSVPVTGFVTCRLLRNEKLFNFITSFCEEIEPHSYEHITVGSERDIKMDIERAVVTFENILNKKPEGYRFPQGRININLIPFMKELGFRYDSSIFPGWRPGVFNNRKFPQEPFFLNGLLELPFATFYKVRTIFSLSYVKLYGKLLTKMKAKFLGLPDIVIIDSHMTDFFFVDSLRLLSLPMKLVYYRNKSNGISLCEFMIILLKKLGYEFTTVGNIYRECTESRT